MKYCFSAVLAVVAVFSVPLLGLTETAADNSNGMLIDFGYWNVSWTDMVFTEDMDGDEALDVACAMNGYEIVRNPDGTVFSIDGHISLPSSPWGLYVVSGTGWAAVEDPSSVIAADEGVLCWARTNSADEITTCVDSTGHKYFGYASDGISKKTGKAMRIVTLSPSITETLCSLGCTENIIGTDLYSDYPSAIPERKRQGFISDVGGYMDPSYELIVKLAPDIVFCDGGVGQHVAMTDKLRKSGIDCCVLYGSTDLEALYTNIWMSACSMGFSERADSEIVKIRRTIDDVAGVVGIVNTRTFVTLSTDPAPWTAGSDTYISDILSKCSAINVFDDFPSWFMVSKEQIYAKQPSLIIVMSSEKVDTEEKYRSLVDGMDPLWKMTPAFQEGRIYVFSGEANDTLSRSGPRLCEAAELIAKTLNPDAFKEEDPDDEIPFFVSDDYRKYLTYQEDSA